MQGFNVKSSNNDQGHPSSSSIPIGTIEQGVPTLKSYSENPWAGAYTKTFLRDDLSQPEMDNNNGTKPYSLVSKLFAEFIGDVLFVFIGALSALKSTDSNAVTHAAFAHGFSIFVLVSSLGHISGGHFNPSVTFAVALAGKLNPLLVVPYVLAQLLGGFVGAVLVRLVSSTDQYNMILGGATLLGSNELWYQGLAVEAILTLFLTQTVLNCAVDTNNNLLAPLAIGLTVALDIFGAGSISGASMNPARSLGPALAGALFSTIKDKSILWTTQWIYWAGPAIGAAVSALLYRTLLTRSYNRIMP